MGSRVFQERALKAQIPIEVFTRVITMMNHFALGRTEDLRKWFRLINSIIGLQLISPFQKLRERQVFTNHVLQKYVGVKEGKQMVLFLDMQVRFGIETDDLVARYWHRLSTEFGRENVMIVSIDKDYKQFPCLMYNYHYKHKTILDISEKEAMYNFYEQMIVGDTADNVNYFKGKGKAFAKKYFVHCDSKYKYTKKLYKLFKDKYKGKARQKYTECYNLLKLRTN